MTAAAVLLLAGCTSAGQDPPDSDTDPEPTASHDSAPRLRGITLPSWAATDYDSPQATAYLRQIADTGARWVTFTPTWYQSRPDESSIHTTEETASDPSLRRITELAHDTGLKVMLKPHVDLKDGTDRAEIRPADRDAWFADYTRFITHYARLAADLGVEQLTVGTELAGTSRDRSGWTGVIAAVRNRYDGPLVYAANYDEYAEVPFWKALDRIGIDAYWPLGDTPTTDPQRLQRAWRPVVRELAAFSAWLDRKVLFTEAGYVSQRGATTAPYSWTVSKVAGNAEQAAAYQALLAAFNGERWWAGVSWWMWDDWPDSGETEKRLAYTPHGKPAEKILRTWWAND